MRIRELGGNGSYCPAIKDRTRARLSTMQHLLLTLAYLVKDPETVGHPGAPNAHPYKRWRRPLDEIRHIDGYNARLFMLDEELNGWIRTRWQQVLFKHASMIG